MLRLGTQRVEQSSDTSGAAREAGEGESLMGEEGWIQPILWWWQLGEGECTLREAVFSLSTEGI